MAAAATVAAADAEGETAVQTDPADVAPLPPRLVGCVSDRTLVRLLTAGGWVLGVCCVLYLAIGWVAGTPDCVGAVMEDLDWGLSGASDYEVADRICCRNTRFAEPSGFAELKEFFSSAQERLRLLAHDARAAGRPPPPYLTFYDSQCRLPIFRAPVGRTFSQWERESVEHGWPSFRRRETFHEHVEIERGGEMHSTCGTHLGHNLPDEDGPRYCINLVCMAGRAPPPNTTVAVRAKSSWGWTESVWTALGMALGMCVSACAIPRVPRSSSLRQGGKAEAAAAAAAAEDAHGVPPGAAVHALGSPPLHDVIVQDDSSGGAEGRRPASDDSDHGGVV